MVLSFLVRGFLAGLAIAAPVGPTTVLLIHRIVKQSLASGYLSGTGAAMADAFFALLAGIGATLAGSYLSPHYLLIRFVGSAFLVYWGFRIFASKFAETHPLVKNQGFGGPLVSTFILSLTNPMTLLAFGTVLVITHSTGLTEHLSLLLSWMLGVGAGSLLWWICLSTFVFFYRKKFNFKILIRINQVIGTIIIIAAVGILIDFIKLTLQTV